MDLTDGTLIRMVLFELGQISTASLGSESFGGDCYKERPTSPQQQADPWFSSAAHQVFCLSFGRGKLIFFILGQFIGVKPTRTTSELYVLSDRMKETQIRAVMNEFPTHLTRKI